MTGRFKEIVSVQKIKDTKTGKVYVGIVDSDFIKVLNELDKENEQLKQENKELEAFRYQVFKSIHKITEKELVE